MGVGEGERITHCNNCKSDTSRGSTSQHTCTVLAEFPSHTFDNLERRRMRRRKMKTRIFIGMGHTITHL